MRLRDIAWALGLFKDHIHATQEGQAGVLRTGPAIDIETWLKKIQRIR